MYEKYRRNFYQVDENKPKFKPIEPKVTFETNIKENKAPQIRAPKMRPKTAPTQTALSRRSALRLRYNYSSIGSLTKIPTNFKV